ncbi:hypothetical protein N9Y42_09240 [Mariniblastus sp.]|nr:hypothetical protein [Mariniblastus sp.]
MNRFRFRIATLLILTAIVAISIEPVSAYFGWNRPTRQVWQIRSFVESLEDSVSYEEFKSEFDLPDLRQTPPLNFSPDLSGHWMLEEGFRMDAGFTDTDGMLSHVMIIQEDLPYYWGWARGNRRNEDMQNIIRRYREQPK